MSDYKIYDRYAHRIIEFKDIANAQVVEAHPLNDYFVEVRFNDGRHGVYDMEPYLKYGTFKPLRDRAFFEKLYVRKDDGVVAWPGDIDIAPERMWTDMTPLTDADDSHREDSAPMESAEAKSHIDVLGYGCGSDGGDRTGGGEYPFRAEENYVYTCFCCGRKLRSESRILEGGRDDRDPWWGVEFIGLPTYGSGFDDLEDMSIIICDACLAQRRKRISQRSRNKEDQKYYDYRDYPFDEIGMTTDVMEKIVNTTMDDSLAPSDETSEQ